ncbi:MAG: DUF6285 domain-containing protein [Anaerolineae bacterium]|jgi:hypothetical protein|nr:DUF6285 domain-containing protein [Anaerolineae bacterium]
MYDRPSAQALIDGARLHLETLVIPAVRGDPKLYFQTLVAINVLKIVGRELDHAETHQIAEWAGLNLIEGQDLPFPALQSERISALKARNAALCTAIRAGVYDQTESLILEHVRQVTIAQLEVANPKYLQTLAHEDHLER